jgi:peptide chain release factor 3
MTELVQEIRKRLTFAIISHPDAGKTTTTEKLLLFGGAIHIAGAVKSNKNSRAAVSDFMQMEKERGISISSSVMGFEYGGRSINLLDTPGHADFSEDTYRGLSAVDSALLLVDSVNGVEERTRKLMEVCRMRSTPIVTFINKLDREGKDPVELLDEVEKELVVQVRPVTWPIGQGQSFKGVYNLLENNLYLFKPGQVEKPTDVVAVTSIDDPALDREVGDYLAKKLRDDVELITSIYPAFDKDEYMEGLVTPVFFGSALNNFGVRELLDNLVKLAPAPQPKKADERMVQPEETKFSGFIFKIHANLDPKHRDRVAFLRICSGRFERNKQYWHVRGGKPYRTANPTAFMAQNRDIIDEAWPGDIVGLHDTGTFKIGDTLTEGEDLHYQGIPSFAPQIFRTIANADPMKDKQFHKGLDQLAEEGVVQVFTKPHNQNVRVLGVVGQLQIEVLQYRLEHEYNAKCRYEPVEYTLCNWITSDDEKALEAFIDRYNHKILIDVRGTHIFMAENPWLLARMKADNPKIRFYPTSEMVESRA